MIGLVLLAWIALWLVPYIFLVRFVLRETQSLTAHIVPAVIFGGLMAPAMFAGGHGVGFGPVALACLAALTEHEHPDPLELLAYLAYWAIAAGILAAITYSLRKRGNDVKSPSDNQSKNPFD
jgi:hypothetical protein